jgi:hypothetical protein
VVVEEEMAEEAPAEEAAAEGNEIPCPACSTLISSDAIMCYACGHRLLEEAAEGEAAEIPCPACGTMISPDAIMCYACGHRLGAEEEGGEESEGEKGRKAPPAPVKKVVKKRVV